MNILNTPAYKAGIKMQEAAGNKDIFDVAKRMMDLPKSKFIDMYIETASKYGCLVEKSVLELETDEQFTDWRRAFLAGMLVEGEDEDEFEAGEWITFAQARRKLGYSPNAIRKARLDGRFLEGEVRKNGTRWELKRDAFQRIWGDKI